MPNATAPGAQRDPPLGDHPLDFSPRRDSGTGEQLGDALGTRGGGVRHAGDIAIMSQHPKTIVGRDFIAAPKGLSTVIAAEAA